MAEEIFVDNNPYGYQLNIAHPLVNKLYFRYKDSKGIGHSIPLSDRERFEFEARTIPWLERKGYGRREERADTPPAETGGEILRDTPDGAGGDDRNQPVSG